MCGRRVRRDRWVHGCVDRPGQEDEGEPPAPQRRTLRRLRVERWGCQERALPTCTPLLCTCVTNTTAPACPPKAEVVDHFPAVPHDFRSSFRDWADEETDHTREVIEAAPAHVVRNRVEAAYAHSDLFERRRILMNDWARYLAKGASSDGARSRRS